jgi:hypothetical protein
MTIFIKSVGLPKVSEYLKTLATTPTIYHHMSMALSLELENVIVKASSWSPCFLNSVLVMNAKIYHLNNFDSDFFSLVSFIVNQVTIRSSKLTI